MLRFLVMNNGCSSKFGGVCWGIGHGGRLYVAGGIFVNDSVETIVWVSGVVNGSGGTVRLDKGVRSLYNISLARLVLALVVTSQRVFDVVSVAVNKICERE